MNVRFAALALVALAGARPAPAQRGLVQGRAVPADGVPALHDLTVSDLRTGQLASVDPDGSFEIEVDDLATARLRIAARGRATAEVRVVGRPRIGSIVLPRGATVSGTVTDARGRRVASLPVRLVDALADLPFFPTLDDPPVIFAARAVTRGDGTFAIAGALPTAGRLVVAQPGGGETVFEPVEVGVPVEITVPALRPGVVRAVDRSGDGVPGVQVFVADGEGRRTSVGTTDAHGVLLGQLPEGRGLFASGEIVLGAVRVGTPRAALPATGMALDVVLRFEDPDLVPTALRGPVPRFSVQTWFGAEPAGGLPLALGDGVRVADQGIVDLPLAPRGTPFVAHVRAPGRARTTVRGVVGSDEPAVFGMAREATVRGRVLDAASAAPVAGVAVLWAGPEDLTRAAELPAEAITGPDGGFVLDGIPAGRGHVVARPPRGGRAATAAIAVREGERVDRLALRVDRGRTVAGRVAHAPAGTVLEAVGESGARAEAALADDGTFRCVDAPFGPTRLRLLLPTPVRLGAPRTLEVGVLPGGSDAEQEVRIDAAAFARVVRGRLDFGTLPLPRDRIAVFVEPIEAASEAPLRHSLWFEGARAWVERGGGFEALAACGPSMVCVVDVATGVILERIDRVDVQPATDALDLGAIRVDARRVTVEVDASCRARARRIDVDLGLLYPGGVGRMAKPSPITQLWERGTGLPLAEGRDAVELLLPGAEVEVRVRSDRFGTPADNILARRKGTPLDGAVWRLGADR